MESPGGTSGTSGTSCRFRDSVADMSGLWVINMWFNDIPSARFNIGISYFISFKFDIIDITGDTHFEQSLPWDGHRIQALRFEVHESSKMSRSSRDPRAHGMGSIVEYRGFKQSVLLSKFQVLDSQKPQKTVASRWNYQKLGFRMNVALKTCGTCVVCFIIG